MGYRGVDLPDFAQFYSLFYFDFFYRLLIFLWLGKDINRASRARLRVWHSHEAIFMFYPCSIRGEITDCTLVRPFCTLTCPTLHVNLPSPYLLVIFVNCCDLVVLSYSYFF